MFLSRLLPDIGKYCVAELLPKGGFRHYFYDDIQSASDQLTLLNGYGRTVYIAQATFDPERINTAVAFNKAKARDEKRMSERTQDNAILLKNFFLDIDCGEKWPLKDQKEAADALRQFIRETSLPWPAVVNSGNGLYAHWILDKAIPAKQWRTLAFLLKQVVAAYSPGIGGDASRTSDSASVLRVPGTVNRKPGKEPRNVTLLKDAEPITLEDFAGGLEWAAKKKKIDRGAVLPPKQLDDVNAEFYSGLEVQSVPSDAQKIAAKCAQFSEMEKYKCDEDHDISHPLWFLLVGVLVHCENSEEVILDWTSGHPSRNAEKTHRTIEQWRDAGHGPSTCFAIGDASPQGCLGCPHKGKIKSPIVLGRPDPVAIQTDEEECEPPEGYKRSEEGLFKSEDDRWVKFYDQDLYVARLAYDESLGYEVMTIKHRLPHEGEMECTIRSSLVNDGRTLMTALADNHIKIVGKKEKNLMVGYLESYQVRLQRKRRMSNLMCQMGWKEARNGTPMFVLGKKIFHADGSVEEASLAKNVPAAVEGYRTSGDLDTWSEATRVFGKPGMEPFAFALLSAFGAPLMKFTGYDGALLSLVGRSGIGKSLVQLIIQSVYGYHSSLTMLQGDTRNSLVKRLGVYGNLPLTIDEITNMYGKDLSELVFQITQGREKTRLNERAVEQANANRWNTLAITSSNSSVVERLSDNKHDASAEINRVFEYHIGRHEAFQGEATEQLYWTIHENYGHAGEKYIRHLTANADKLQVAIKQAKEKIDGKIGAKGEERFWSAVAAVNYLGGLIAHRLGIIKFDPTPALEWSAQTIFDMRNSKEELAEDSVGVLAQFLDEYAAGRLVVTGVVNGWQNTVIVEQPRGSLVYRMEVDTKRLYISRAVFKAWLAKRWGAYGEVKKELEYRNVLKNANGRRNLGAGTYLSGAQQAVWEIDLTAPALNAEIIEKVILAEQLAENGIHKITKEG